MLSKAAKEGIVVDINNLHKEFFVPKREENNKITAARLPYFDGAYWLGAAETISKKLEEEEISGKLCIKSPNKRTLKALGQDNPTKDVLVMQQVNSILSLHKFHRCYSFCFTLILILILLQLGDKVRAKKKNLMIVCLQNTCTSCHEVMVSGSRWFCNQCNIQLCSRCFDSGKLPSAKKMHKCQSGKKTRLSEVSHVIKQVCLFFFLIF